MLLRATRSPSESWPGTPIRRNAFAPCPESEGASLINSSRNAINWLIEGLMQAWAAIEDRLWPPRRLLLVQTTDGFMLQRPDGQAAVEGLQIGGPAADFPPEAAALVKDGEVDVVLPV